MTYYAALVAEARKIAEKATSAPWFSDGVRVILDDRNSMVDLRLVAIAQSESPRMTSGHEADAAFIARARTLVPELCDAVQEQAEELAVLRAQVARVEALPKKWREHWPKEYSPFDECADELDAALSKPEPEEK